MAETYIMSLVDLLAPTASDVQALAMMPPSTARSSLIAPYIVSLTGIMSALFIPMASAERGGMMELWQPESATMGMVTVVSLDLSFTGKSNAA